MVFSIQRSSSMTSALRWTQGHLFANRWTITICTGIAFLGIAFLFFRRKPASPTMPPASKRHKLSVSQPCLNDETYLRFNKLFAQGIFKIHPSFSSSSAKPVSLSCIYKKDNQSHLHFHYQRLSPEDSSGEIFIPNMPYGEEIIIETMMDDETCYEQKIRIIQPLATYEIKKNNVVVKTLGQLSDTVSISGLKNKIEQPMKFILQADKIEEATGTEAFCVIQNRQAKHVVFTFELAFLPTKLNSYSFTTVLGENVSREPPNLCHLAIPFVIPPNGVLKLSKEFLMQTWRDTYLRSNATRCIAFDLSNPDLTLTAVQATAYSA